MNDILSVMVAGKRVFMIVCMGVTCANNAVRVDPVIDWFTTVELSTGNVYHATNEGANPTKIPTKEVKCDSSR